MLNNELHISMHQKSSALHRLREISIADKGNFRKALDEGKQIGFFHYFPSLIALNQSKRMAILLVEDEGSVCVFRWILRDGIPRLDLLFAPCPMNIEVLNRCLERANDYNGDRSARVLGIDEKDAASINKNTSLKLREGRSQYLFDPDSYSDISGRRFRNVRRYVSRIQATEGLVVNPYSQKFEQECLNFLKKWRRHHRDTHGTRGGVNRTKRIIQTASQFNSSDMRGEIITIDGEIVGFAFGGEMRAGVAAFLEAKCDFTIQGLSYFQRYHFMVQMDYCKLINDGSDVGRAGLAQLKSNLRPVGMHRVYNAGQRK